MSRVEEIIKLNVTNIKKLRVVDELEQQHTQITCFQLRPLLLLAKNLPHDDNQSSSLPSHSRLLISEQIFAHNNFVSWHNTNLRFDSIRRIVFPPFLFHGEFETNLHSVWVFCELESLWLWQLSRLRWGISNGGNFKQFAKWIWQMNQNHFRTLRRH